MNWAPIPEAALRDKIIEAEARMTPPIRRLWEAIRIPPQKWREPSYGQEGGGFWVVGLIGHHAIWYNDIEEGFNRASYRTPGELDEYFSNQDELEHVVQDVLSLIETGAGRLVRTGPPRPC